MDEQHVAPQRPMKSPGFAGFLGLFPFGLGALYNGQYLKFLLYLIIFPGLIRMQSHGGQPFFALLLTGFIFFQFIDNIQSAKAINAAAVKSQEAGAVPFVEDVVSSGSIFWGIFLIALGVLLILANFEIIRYSTLADLWPLAVIVIGLKLVAESVAKSKSNGQ